MSAREKKRPSEPPAVPVDDIRELVQMMQEYSLSEIEWRDGERHLRLAKQTARQETQPPASSVAFLPAGMPYMLPSTGGPFPPVQQLPIAPSDPSAAQAEQPARPAQAEQEEELLTIKSPMVGTFYAAPAPDKPPFVEVGSHVEPDTIVCIIEAMKVFNEIPAEVSGKIVKVLVENGQPVEYGQPLFLVDPTG